MSEPFGDWLRRSDPLASHYQEQLKRQLAEARDRADKAEAELARFRAAWRSARARARKRQQADGLTPLSPRRGAQ